MPKNRPRVIQKGTTFTISGGSDGHGYWMLGLFVALEHIDLDVIEADSMSNNKHESAVDLLVKNNLVLNIPCGTLHLGSSEFRLEPIFEI